LEPAPWLANFWRTLKLVDKSKLNTVGMSLRNALAVGLPLAVGIASGHSLAGVAVASGALNVAYSDGHDPYAHRARRMLAWTFLGAVAVFLGSVTGNYHVLAILVASAWALAAGLLVSIGTRAGDLGLNTLVTLVIYAARGAMSPLGALYAALLVLGGGLFQTGLALLFWPVRGSRPERSAVGKIYDDLAQHVGEHPDALLTTTLKPPTSEVQDTLSALGRDHSLEGERLRVLFDQADRLRFSIYSVQRLRTGLEHERKKDESSRGPVEILDEILDVACNLLSCVSTALIEDNQDVVSTKLLEELRRLTKEAQLSKTGSSSLLTDEFASAIDTVAGQLRVVAQLAGGATTAGAEEFAKTELAPPLKLQVRSWLSTLAANLDIHSSAFRHGIRLAICVAIADAIGRSISVQRNYWLAMTVAVVLKPDFTSTITRGVLRLCGTFAGLALATVLFHLLPSSAFTQLALVGTFTFLMRYAGPANYGLFSIAISGLIVFLIAATGVAPAQVVAQRAINTAAGGVFALVAYLLWPTWERSQASDTIADMIDRMRDYFRLVTQRLMGGTHVLEPALDEAREAWRQARSRSEASVDRLSSEPGTPAGKLDCLTSILASSHVVVRVTMGLEAGVIQSPTRPLSAEFETFAQHVEFTLYFLSAALRGSHLAASFLPNLRDDHRRLLDAYSKSKMANDYLILETDPLTVGLNTLREQVLSYIPQNQNAAPQPVHTTIE
jgi:uncharacterized membrane protein YccC